VQDPSELDEYYRKLSDEELQDAAREGRDAYRPDAWQVIQSELARRGRSGFPRRRGGREPRDRGGSVGMAIAFFPAVAIAGAVITNFAGRGGRMILVAIGMGLMTWIGLGVWIDLLMHRLTRRRDTKESAR